MSPLSGLDDLMALVFLRSRLLDADVFLVEFVGM